MYSKKYQRFHHWQTERQTQDENLERKIWFTMDCGSWTQVVYSDLYRLARRHIIFAEIGSETIFFKNCSYLYFPKGLPY